MAQHLKAVDAAAAISRAQWKGLTLDSTYLEFYPGNPLRALPVRYRYSRRNVTRLADNSNPAEFCKQRIIGDHHRRHARSRGRRASIIWIYNGATGSRRTGF